MPFQEDQYTVGSMLVSRRSSRYVTVACTANRWQRIIYGVVAIFMTAFGVSALVDNLVVGFGGLLLAAGAAIMAMTGLCWTDWFAPRNQPAQPDQILGFPYVQGVITLDTTKR